MVVKVVIKDMLRVCGTVIREEHNGVARSRSALSVCVCAPCALTAHVSAVQVGHLLEMMGYVQRASSGKDHTVNFQKLQDDCINGRFWADAAQKRVNVEHALQMDGSGVGWGTLSTLPMDAHGSYNFGGLHLKLVFCVVASAHHGLQHKLTLDRVVRFGMGEIRKHQKLWQARWPCAFRVLAVSYRFLRLQVILNSPLKPKGKGSKAANPIAAVPPVANKASGPAPIQPPALEPGITQVRFGLVCCAGQRIIRSRCCSLSWRSRRRRSWRLPSS